MMTLGQTVCVAVVALLLAGPVRAEQIDWQKYCIDGVELSGNSDVRYLKTEPRINVVVRGKTHQAAAGLVDADGPGRTSIAWTKGENIDIDLDLTAERLVAGIVVIGGGAATWQMSASLDRRNWREIPRSHIVRINARSLMAANLALPARYLRVQATPSENGARIRDIYVYGDKEADGPAVGGIYPSWFPPVAGEEVTLRTIVRNVTDQTVKNVKVAFRQTAPRHKTLGEDVIAELPAGSARVAAIRWKPAVMEPHEIFVTASGPGPQGSQRTEIIPVVKRRLYFGNYHPIDNERLKNANLYTVVGGGFEYFLAKIRGRLALHFCNGPHVSGNVGLETFTKTWSHVLQGPLRDGMAMDEWSTLYPEACAALEQVSKDKGDRIIVPWLSGRADEAYSKCFRHADLVLPEVYFNYAGHHTYRDGLNVQIDNARKWQLLDKWIIALGVFAPGKPSTAEEIEREVQYLRLRGPEMPGVAYYGYSRGDIVRKNDHLCYQYFIAPVVVIEEAVPGGGNSLRVTVRNIGGMTAHHVQLAALGREDEKKQGTAAVAVLAPDEQTTVVINTIAPPADVVARILPGPGYTALNSTQPLEVYPSSQVQGLPIVACWTPENADDTGRQADHLDFVNLATGKVDSRVDAPGEKGTWKSGNLYLPSLETGSLAPGRYQLRWVDGQTGRTQGRNQLTILQRAGKLSVSRVNERPGTDNPQEITIDPGDTFDISWDLRDCRLPNPSIYISAPGDDMKMPRQDGSFAVLRPAVLGQRVESPTCEPERVGTWRWKSRIEREDLLLPFFETNGGWIWFRGDLGPDYRRVNMAANPGTWRLWIGGASPAVPISPVITVNVRGRQTAPPQPTEVAAGEPGQGGLEVKINAPKQMTTGDMVIVTVTASVKDRVVVGSEANYVDGVELFKMDQTGHEINNIPKLKLMTVQNRDKSAREFTAHFMITSPEQGTQRYCVRVGNPERFVPFSIEVEPKTVPVGKQDSIKLAMALPDGIVDTENLIDRFELVVCGAKPEFGPDRRTAVRRLTNMPALQEARGERLAGKYNPDKMSPKFEAELPVGPEDEPRIAHYLVWYGYIGRNGHWAPVTVHFTELTQGSYPRRDRARR